ncbi:MAG TPA: sialidase family protein [Chloroflexota bacterium]|nr:sialidase family protein [Chloroflexota bacterium]
MSPLARPLLTLATVASLLAVLAFPGIRPHLVQASAGIGFGATTVVDDQRLGGEPDIKTCGPSATWSEGSCGLNNPYASIPWGFSTTTSYIWRSEDGGKTFRLVPSNNLTGKPDNCPGGGDTDLALSPAASQSQDSLLFEDLQGLTNISTGASSNGGATWVCNPISSFASAVDRQWLGLQGPLGGSGSVVYMDYDIADGAAAYPSTQCALGNGAAGNAFVIQTSTDGGVTFSPFTVVSCNDGIAGNIQVNQATHEVFAIHTAYANPATANTADTVEVDTSTDGGQTWTPHTVSACTPTATSDCTTGQDFAVLAIDKSGGLYAVWSQAPTDASGNINGPSHIYYSYSGNNAATWTAARQVDAGSTNVNLFPWVIAGKAGAIDIVWYGTAKSAAATGWDPGAQASNWYPYLSQSLNANTAAPTFSAPVAVAQHPNHYGGICTMGIGCTTGGDRSLADFFQVDIDQSGAARVIWADTSDNGASDASGNAGALIDEAQQVSGPTLFGTTLKGSAPTCAAVTSTPCASDPTGDARYEANGSIGPNVPKLDITGSSVGLDPADLSKLDVRLKVANLSSLPTTADLGADTGDLYADYLTSWNYHIPGDTDTQYDSTGNVYYAYLEVNLTTGALTAYDGNTCSLDSTKPKYLVYPGQNQIQYGINESTGTIDLYVPLKDVGNPPVGASLYSVTAHTVGQPGPAGPSNCPRLATGNNFDASGQLFNTYDKSAAYTAILNKPRS